MSKEIQSASVRAEANCGAEAKTPSTSTARGEARNSAYRELTGVRECLRIWLRDEGTAASLEVDPASGVFCETLADALQRAERALASIPIRDELADGELRALLLIGGVRELLTMAADAEPLPPLAGYAIQSLVLEAEKALLTGECEVLQ